MCRASLTYAQSVRIVRIRPSVTAKWVDKIADHCPARPRRGVIQIEYLLVKLVRSRHLAKYRINVFQRRCFKRRAGQHHIRRRRKHQTHSLGVEKEKQLVSDDRTADRSSPLIRDVEGPEVSPGMAIPAVGIQRGAIPWLRGVA